MLDRNTWNNLTVCKQMSSNSSSKNKVTDKTIQLQIIYIYIYIGLGTYKSKNAVKHWPVL